MPDYSLISNILTLGFESTAAIGGIYLVVGFALHMLASWGACAPAVSTTVESKKRLGSEQPVQEDPTFAMSGSQDELRRLSWFERNIVENQAAEAQPVS